MRSKDMRTCPISPNKDATALDTAISAYNIHRKKAVRLLIWIDAMNATASARVRVGTSVLGNVWRTIPVYVYLGILYGMHFDLLTVTMVRLQCVLLVLRRK